MGGTAGSRWGLAGNCASLILEASKIRMDR